MRSGWIVCVIARKRSDEAIQTPRRVPDRRVASLLAMTVPTDPNSPYHHAMQPEHPKYWFPAKRYGWGWGIPDSWQGWLVLLTFLALTIGGGVLISPAAHPVWFVGYIATLSVVLMIVCLLKGEPLRWRWGDDDRS